MSEEFWIDSLSFVWVSAAIDPSSAFQAHQGIYFGKVKNCPSDSEHHVVSVNDRICMCKPETIFLLKEDAEERAKQRNMEVFGGPRPRRPRIVPLRKSKNDK